MQLTTYQADWDDTGTQAIAREYRRVFKAESWAEVPVTAGNVCTDKAKFIKGLGANCVNAEAIAEVLSRDPDAQSDAESDGWECPQDVDYTPDYREADWLECVNFNVIHHRRWNAEAVRDESWKRINDRLDSEAWNRHVERTVKARRYHGIEEYVFDKAGRVRAAKPGKAARIAAKLAKLDAKKK